jgi:hypothetical protein
VDTFEALAVFMLRGTFVILVAPIVVYQCVKMGVVAYFKGLELKNK